MKKKSPPPWASNAPEMSYESAISLDYESGIITHGFNCKKEPHLRNGMLHGEEDDGPYDVDGLPYCGRCHWAL